MMSGMRDTGRISGVLGTSDGTGLLVDAVGSVVGAGSSLLNAGTTTNHATTAKAVITATIDSAMTQRRERAGVGRSGVGRSGGPVGKVGEIFQACLRLA